MIKKYKNNIIVGIVGLVIFIIGGILQVPVEGSNTIREIFGIIFSVTGVSLFFFNFVQIIRG